MYAFEPLPENFGFLSENIQLNALSNTKCFNVGVGPHDQRAALRLHRNQINSLFSYRGVPAYSQISVELWSLGRILETVGERIDLVKLDIEGMEFDALFSCLPSDLERVERIVLEYHDETIDCGHKVSELVGFLEMHKFTTQLFPAHRILAAWRNRKKRAL